VPEEAGVTLTVRPRFNAAVAVALLDQGHCACFGCNGRLVRSDRWPSWRRCPECRCMRKVDLIGDRRYVCRVRGGGCVAE
jgi:hypothetical protein